MPSADPGREFAQTQFMAAMLTPPASARAGPWQAGQLWRALGQQAEDPAGAVRAAEPGRSPGADGLWEGRDVVSHPLGFSFNPG
jgi:hypothetical protein